MNCKLLLSLSATICVFFCQLLAAQEDVLNAVSLSVQEVIGCPQNPNVTSGDKCWASPQEYIEAYRDSDFENIEWKYDCLRFDGLAEHRWCVKLSPTRLSAIEFQLKNSTDTVKVSRALISLGMHYYQEKDNANFTRIAEFAESSRFADHEAKASLLLNYVDKVSNAERKIRILRSIAELCTENDLYDDFSRPGIVITAGPSALSRLLQVYKKAGNQDKVLETARFALQKFHGGWECVAETENCGDIEEVFVSEIMRFINRLPSREKKEELLKATALAPQMSRLAHHTILMDFDLPGKDFKAALADINASAGLSKRNWKTAITEECVAKFYPSDIKLFDIKTIGVEDLDPINEWDYMELSARCLVLGGADGSSVESEAGSMSSRKARQ